MKTIFQIFLFTLLFQFLFHYTGQSQCLPDPVAFSKHFGTDQDDSGLCIARTEEHQFIVGSRTNIGSGNEGNILVSTINLEGEILNSMRLSTSSREFPTSLAVLPDGTNVLSANCSFNNTNATIDDWVYLRLDEDGEIMHSKAFGTNSSNEEVYDVISTSDGNIVLAGLSSNTNSEERAALKKLSPSGTVIWSLTTNSTGSKRFSQVVENNLENAYFAAGYMENYNDYGAPILYKVAQDGTIIGSFAYVIPNLNIPVQGVNQVSLCATPDNGCIMSCRFVKTSSNSDILVIKLDEDGQVEWSKSFGGNDIENTRGIKVSLYDRYILWGSTNSFGSNFDAFALELDLSGEPVWARRYGSEGFDEITDLDHFLCDENDDNTNDWWGYMAVGTSSSYSALGDDNIWLLKFDSNGEGFTECYSPEVPFNFDDETVQPAQLSGTTDWDTETTEELTETEINYFSLPSNCDIIITDGFIGLADQPNNEINIFPNPADDRIYVQPQYYQTVQTVELLDPLGRVLMTNIPRHTSSNIEIDINEIKYRGVALVKVTFHNGTEVTQRLIIQ